MLPEMHDTILSLWGEIHTTSAREPLTRRPNKEGLTPLCAAAKYGLADIFNHMINSMCETQWSFGPVTCVVLPLDGLDYIPGEESGAIEHIVREGHLDLVSLPLVQELLAKKWEAFVQDIFIRRFKWSLLQSVMFTLMVVFDPESADSSSLRAVSFAMHWVCRAALSCLAVHKLSIELRELYTEGFHRYFGKGDTVAGYLRMLQVSVSCSRFWLHSSCSCASRRCQLQSWRRPHCCRGFTSSGSSWDSAALVTLLCQYGRS
ncbi:unnamed protein product [Prorocentrum cordatum]|uniref:Uncharacterized protein n=1 Tax=Prorocentrum cordatum TaxID=2364126 RepID=A0ABN9T3L4_9DINO|nr:unnamed protein product [Polarella glacialis]